MLMREETFDPAGTCLNQTRVFEFTEIRANGSVTDTELRGERFLVRPRNAILARKAT